MGEPKAPPGVRSVICGFTDSKQEKQYGQYKGAGRVAQDRMGYMFRVVLVLAFLARSSSGATLTLQLLLNGAAGHPPHDCI